VSKPRSVRELRLPLDLSPALWEGSFNGRECSLHQLAPYVGKLKTGMVKAIIAAYTVPGDLVADPFCGSGVVPLEALLMGRRAAANDLSAYAFAVTRGKLAAPATLDAALGQARAALDFAAAHGPIGQEVPEWVRAFFHPRTLDETLAVLRACDKLDLPFIRACMLGILHHVRPGFLSYPASHLTPYLRLQKYPPAEYPEMYAYRSVAPRLLAKVERAYRRPPERAWAACDWHLACANSMALPWEDEWVDAIVSSPPYFGALDYARDNRLRLWFLGVPDWRQLDRALTANDRVYLPQMRACLAEMHRILKPGAPCILVLGDVTRNGHTRNTAEIVAELAEESESGGFDLEQIIEDTIPDDRRSRRATRTTIVEKIVVLRRRPTSKSTLRYASTDHALTRRPCQDWESVSSAV